MVIMSQQYFLYRPTIFIPMNAKNIPAPTRHPPQISILISQYIIPAMTGLDIPSLICATFFPVSTIQPAMVCIKVAIVSKNLPQSEMEKGLRCSGSVCYGYRASKEEKGEWIIDEEAATGNPEAVERYENYLVTRRESYHRKKQEAERTA